MIRTNYNIVKWLKKQNLWLQEAAIRLLSKKSLVDKDVLDLVKIIKGEATANPDLSKFRIVEDSIDKVHLISLGKTHGIDRLNPRKPLEFGSGNISVIYGLNGSGKSGYSRIIKKMCGKSEGKLKYNVFSTPPSEQTCQISFSINGDVLNKKWDAKDNDISELRSIDIFDREVGDAYLQQEKEASYVPIEMNIFEDLVDICEKIKVTLNNEKSGLVSKLPTLPDRFNSTNVARKYENISNNQYDELIEFNDSNNKDLLLLIERLNTPDPSASAKTQRARKKHIESIKQTLLNASVVSSPDYSNNLKKLNNDAVTQRRIALDGAVVLGEVSKLDGIGSISWKALWEAARNYSESEAYPDKPYPNAVASAVCVLCHQKLSEEAVGRLKDFESFIKGTLEKKAIVAEEAIDRAIKEIPLKIVKSDFETEAQAADINEELRKSIWNVLDKSNAIIEKFQNKAFSEDHDKKIPDCSEIIEQLDILINEANLRSLQFDKDALTFDRDKTQSDALELEAKQWVSQQKDAINEELIRLDKLKKYNNWISETNTSWITREAGIVSEKIVTESYVGRFNDELKKLNASGITVSLVKTRNIKGKGNYRIQLKKATMAGVNPSDVLSDGEKRIVALAAFLADATGRAGNASFVFDDPISSLDQKYEEKMIDRLVELSEDRQVLVFTHRLSLLSILTDKADDTLNTICISNEPWGTGEPVEIPINAKSPGKALNKLMNNMQVANKAYTQQGTEAYEILAQSICSSFRNILERIVEIVLLADVVQRHRRAVTTKNKIHNLAKITLKDCEFIDEMMTKYSIFDHSQSLEAPAHLPEPDELTEDIQRAIDWNKEFSKR